MLKIVVVKIHHLANIFFCQSGKHLVSAHFGKITEKMWAVGYSQFSEHIRKRGG
jgi:hypothetical protein